MRRAAAPGGTLVVLGGAGAMGRITARDLCETAPSDVGIVVADVNGRAARSLVAELNAICHRPALRALALDITRTAAAAKALSGAFGLLNCCHHDFNLAAMQVALKAGCHYLDLGGLFHVTRKQLRLHAQFKRRGRLALLGMGAAPGIVNVLARAAGDDLDEVHEIHVAVGAVDRAPRPADRVLAASYSIQTVLDEASLPAPVFTGGRFGFVAAMSGTEVVRFPDPVGTQSPSRTIHSEVATLPQSFRKKGIREVSFRIAFAPDLDRQLRLLSALGLLSRAAVRVGRVTVAPRDVLTALLKDMPKPEAGGPPDEYEVLRVTVRGRRDGGAVEEVLDCHVRGMPAWGVGVDVDTGCPPSIAMQMLLRGDIPARGVLPPELAVPAAPFFDELQRRGMRVERARRQG